MSPLAKPSQAGRALRAAAGAAPLSPATDQGAVTPVRDDPPPSAQRAAPAPQARPTRITVDLAADLHGFLRGYAQARDVAAADVIRELLRQVRADADLSARVTAELERRREALAEAMRAARE